MNESSKTQSMNFTEGAVYVPLFKFALPILGALFLQALYGGIDLLIVGQFASTADVSGVATGSMIMQSLTMVVVGLSMGVTILVAQKIGEGSYDYAGEVVGSGIAFFAAVGIVWTLFMIFMSENVALLLQAPKEAFSQTSGYIRICGTGAIFITAYNVLGSIFRGIGDSKMPLITVAISASLNVIGDLFFVKVLGMGASGAAWATIISQALSVAISLLIIRKRKLPFKINRDHICFNRKIIASIIKLGAPLALQDLLVGISFLVIMGIVNSLGVEKSAGVGVAQRVFGFILLFPSAFSQSVSTFVAQNFGAGKNARASKGLFYGIATSLAVGVVIGTFAFFRGNLLSSVFSHDAEVIVHSHNYLKAFAFDTILTSFLFCFIGYFNGIGKTLFSMIQGIVGAFCVRIPVAFLVVKLVDDPSLFQIGLATPISTVVQIAFCAVSFIIYGRKIKSSELQNSRSQ